MRTRLLTLSLLGLFTTAGAAGAQEVRGVVTRADPDQKQVTVEVRGRGGRGLAMTFRLGSDTQITVGRQPATAADLEPGTRVRVRYEDEDGRHVAVSILARGLRRPQPPPAAPATPGAPAPTPADPNVVTGILRRIALTDREIVVIGPGPKGEPEAETTVSVPEATPITRGGKAVQLEDLKEDERVAVRVERRGGKVVARAVDVGPGAQAPRAAAAPDRNRIARLRALLKMADYFLEQMDQQRQPPPPPREPARP